MRIVFAMALVAVTLFSSSASAADVVSIDSTPAQIRTAQGELRQAIERKSKNYSHFTDDERKTIFARQDEVLSLIDGKQDVAELGPDGKIALANALEAVKASVARAEDNRMICERIKPVGSNRPKKKASASASVGACAKKRSAVRCVPTAETGCRPASAEGTAAPVPSVTGTACRLG